jgi:hypothetical protein
MVKRHLPYRRPESMGSPVSKARTCIVIRVACLKSVRQNCAGRAISNPALDRLTRGLQRPIQSLVPYIGECEYTSNRGNSHRLTKLRGPPLGVTFPPLKHLCVPGLIVVSRAISADNESRVSNSLQEDTARQTFIVRMRYQNQRWP